MRTHNIHKTLAIALAALLILATGKAAAGAAGTDLQLAKAPLFGLNVEPNVLLVLDDSTTMDLEVLFKDTRDGVLYWKPCLLALIPCTNQGERPTYQNGHYVNGIGPQYAFGYLFPNGINSWSGKTDRRTTRHYKAIPPLPYMGFARSPSYNKMYFDPNVIYKPWPNMSDSDADSSDPAPGTPAPNVDSSDPDDANALDKADDGFSNDDNDTAFDLTSVRGEYGAGELFTYGDWMGTIPENRKFIGCTTGSLLLRLAHEEKILNEVLGTSTVKTVFGILFGLLSSVSNLPNALNNLLELNLVDVLASVPELLGVILELVAQTLIHAPQLLTGQMTIMDLLQNVLSGSIDLLLSLLNVLGLPAPCLGFHWDSLATDDGLIGGINNILDAADQLVVGNITGHTSQIALQYYPATFFLYKSPAADEISLPDGYGYDQKGETITAEAPDGRRLVRYQINSDNFTTDTAYQAAIDNFANWFTYYRKRHLAVRGALMQAMQKFKDKNIRVGVTTTNQPDDFTMYSLKDKRDKLYDAIESLDFSQESGSPNREALQFTGEQLRGNEKVITNACQTNYAMLVTDGFNSAGISNSPDVDTIGDADSDNGSVFDDNDPGSNTYSGTIADVAMHYYEDLTLTSGVKDNLSSDAVVPTPGACSANPPLRLDCQSKPHMVTYGMSLGQNGTIFQNSTSKWWQDWGTKKDAAYKDAVPWPDVNMELATDDSADNLYEAVDNLLGGVNGLLNILLGKADSSALDGKIMGAEQIDDLWHATVNSRGDMYLADTPDKMVKQFKSMLREITSTNASGSAASLAAGENLIFQPLLMSYDWSGELLAYNQTDDGSPDDIAWRASERIPAPADRVIIMGKQHDCSGGKSGQSSPPAAFTYDNMKNGCPALSKPAVQYLRGVAPKDIENGGNFRNRHGNVLGDIVHSDPVVVGTPKRSRYPRKWNDLLREGDTGFTASDMPENQAPDYRQPDTDDATVDDFYERYEDRMSMVYVGANDGMLHGFRTENSDEDATTPPDAGTEVLAFIPGVLLGELGQLTDPTYQHRPYVDGSPTVGDVVFDGGGVFDPNGAGTPEWHTVLVGGLRGGGQAIYALDITDPSKFSVANADDIVMWEFTDDDLGFTYGEPSIVRLHNGDWAAIFANGYNNHNTEGEAISDARLFIVDIETGDKLAEITVPSALTDTSKSNGLAQPTPVDVDGDFIVDYVYAGDLQGNMWKFDLTSATASNWELPTNVSKLFSTEDDADKAQPITSAPVVGVHPNGRSYGVMVYFGTGKLLEQTDTSPLNPQNSFYGIWDPNVIDSTIEGKSVTVDRDDDLVEQDILTNTVDKNGKSYRVLTDKEVNYSNSSDSDRGWHIDLIGSGEIVINNPFIRRGTVGFTTALPEAATCSPGGTGFIMRVAADNGGRTTTPAFDVSGDGDLSDDDTLKPNDPDNKVDKELVGASGVLVKTGRPSEATFVPNSDTILHNTTSTKIQQSPTPQLEGIRRTWRVIRLTRDIPTAATSGTSTTGTSGSKITGATKP